MRRWSWEIVWLTGGVFSWLIAPWIFAAVQTHDLLAVLWGLGGLTFGLTLRYLGLSLGMAGRAKEAKLSSQTRRTSIGEFNFSEGVLVAIVSRLTSRCFAFGLAAGEPIRRRTSITEPTRLGRAYRCCA